GMLDSIYDAAVMWNGGGQSSTVGTDDGMGRGETDRWPARALAVPRDERLEDPSEQMVGDARAVVLQRHHRPRCTVARRSHGRHAQRPAPGRGEQRVLGLEHEREQGASDLAGIAHGRWAARRVHTLDPDVAAAKPGLAQAQDAL